jgi:hypothetical protein
VTTTADARLLSTPERRDRIEQIAENYRKEPEDSSFRPILAGYVRALSPLPGWLADLTFADYVKALDSELLDTLVGVGL